MPYSATRRLYHVAGKKVSKEAMYRKARKMCNEISRNMSLLESRYLKSRMNHV